jgi:hypothetical protein
MPTERQRLLAKWCQLWWIEGVVWSAQRIPKVVNLDFLNRVVQQTPEIFKRVRQDFLRRCTTCIEAGGRHFAQLIWVLYHTIRIMKNKTVYRNDAHTYYSILHLEIQDRVEPPIGISYYRFPIKNTPFGLLYHLYHFDTIDQKHPV